MLEECRRDGVRELVLVNCCDTIRSAYDVLLESGKLDFIFMLDMLHNTDACSRERTRNELLRLAKAYGAYKGAAFDEAKFFAAFEERPRPSEDYISVLGAGGDGIVSDDGTLHAHAGAQRHVREQPLCGCAGGNRDGFRRPDGWYAAALLGQLPCMRMRMTDTAGRKQLVNDPHLKAVIYHTVKFCDYYGFEYSHLRRELTQPMLKLESDYTVQSSGSC